MLPHIGEGLGHLAGEPAQIGLDEIQGGVPAVIRKSGLVGGLVAVQGIQVLVQGHDVRFDRLIEGRKVLGSVVPPVNDLVAVAGIAVIPGVPD